MPFTLSHPAAVLPLLRQPFSAVALVAGAVAPDAPYFARRLPIPVTAQSWYEPFMNATTSHGLVGAVTVSLPYALALCVLCWVARRPVGALLPGLVDGAGSGGLSGLGAVARRCAWVSLSLLIGIATHLVWDSFTHGDGWVVLHVAFLREPLVGGLTWARALQHVSTIAGLALIAVYMWRRRSGLRSVLHAQHGDRFGAGWTLGFVAGVAAIGAVVGTLELWGAAGLTPREMTEGLLSGAATGAGAAIVGAMLLFVAGWWMTYGACRLRDRL